MLPRPAPQPSSLRRFIVTRVLINLLYLDPGRTGGMEVVARHLLPELFRAAPADWTFEAIVNARADATEGPWQEIRRHRIDVDVIQRVHWIRAEIFGVPRVAKRAGADLIHSLGNTGPLWSTAPRVVTIHDLIHHRVPQRTRNSRAAREIVGRTAKRADRIIVPATQTQHDLVSELGIPADRIDVVHNGVAAPSIEPTPAAELRERLRLGDRPLVLSPSARQPHKNLPRLLEAHALLPAPRPLLVLPGYDTENDDALHQRTRELGIDADVRWLGWVTEADLEGLYAEARLLVFPSLYEGFGLPVAEAMLRGLPLACSGNGSLAEIAGDAALIFDPTQPASIADAVESLLTDEALRTRLVPAGRAQAAQFTWENAARGYVRSFERALGTGDPQGAAALR